MDKNIPENFDLTETLINFIKQNKLEHDIIEISYTLKNTRNPKENILVSAESTIKNIEEIKKINLEPFIILTIEPFKQLLKIIDEMEYFRLFEPNHYKWINSEEYKDWLANEIVKEKSTLPNIGTVDTKAAIRNQKN